MKKLLLRIKLFIISFLGNEKKFERFLLEHVDPAIDLVSQIQKAVNSPVVAAIVSLLPPAVQVAEIAIKERVLSILDEVAKDILIGSDILQLPRDERLRQLIAYLKTLSPKMQEAAYLKTASLYAKKSSGEDIPQPLMDGAIQNRFIELNNIVA
jgi:hypothetical protein